MTQEEKNKLLELIFTMRNQTIEEEAKSQLSNEKKGIIQELKNETASIKKVMESNDIKAQREKRKGCESWQMYHKGKVDAYGIIISVLEEIIKVYE